MLWENFPVGLSWAGNKPQTQFRRFLWLGGEWF